MTRRVMIVDDHALVREALTHLLESESSNEVAAEGDARVAVETATRVRPDLVLMDVDLGPTDGIELTRRITRAVPGTVVVMLSASCTPALVRSALAAGAHGYLVKGDSGCSLLAAVAEATEGGWPMGPQVATLPPTDTWPMTRVVQRREVEP